MNEPKQKMLVTGASGFLGSNLIYFLKERYEITAVSFTQAIEVPGIVCLQVDLRDQHALAGLLKVARPDIIVHAAAMAEVDYCEQHPAEAETANVTATQTLVEALRQSPVRLVYISTVLVYEGSRGNYRETDALCPINVYAATKEAAEHLVLQHPQALVLRTNFYGFDTIRKRSLAEWGIAQLNAGNRIEGFADVIFSSIYTGDLASLMDEMLIARLSGVFNMGCSSSLSKYDFLVLLGDLMGMKTTNIWPSSIDSRIFPARRAKNLSLNVDKLAKALKRPVPTMRESLCRFVKDYRSSLRHSLVNGVALKGER